MDKSPAPEEPSIDPLAILQTLGRPGPARAFSVSGGADTAIWRIEQGTQCFALRVFRPEQTATARREVAAMDRARAGGLPVPAVHAAGIWRERPAVLLTWMPGTPLRDELIARPWRAWSLGIALGRTQAAIHAVPGPVGRPGESRSWIDWAEPDDALRQMLCERDRGGGAVLHLDLHPLNVLVLGDRVTAVLDWANARSGDPRADLARTASILRFAPLPAGRPAPLARTVRSVLETGWRRGYREKSGSIRGMAPFYAWAAAVMVNDLSPRLGRHDLPWLTPAFLDRVRVWGTFWRVRAGLTE